MLVEFRAIVCLNILNLSIKQEVQTMEKVFGGNRAVAPVHSGKGYLGMAVNGSENVSLLSLTVAYHGIETEQKTRDRFSFELGDLLPRTGETALSIDSRLFGRLVVEASGFDDALDLPG